MTKQEKLILLEKIYGSESAKMFKENMALSFKSIVPSSMVGSMALQKMTEDATGRKRIQPQIIAKNTVNEKVDPHVTPFLQYKEIDIQEKFDLPDIDPQFEIEEEKAED